MVNSKLAILALFGAFSAALASRVSFIGTRKALVAEQFPELAATPQLHRRSGETNLVDLHDGFYLTNITLNGAPFTVLIDTGSSDLWINSKLDNATDTGVNGSITYVAGTASGALKLADLGFAGNTVKKQVFMAVEENHTGSQFGVLGLGPNSASVWFQTFSNNSAAASPLTRIFAANTSSQMYITTTLGRATDDPAHPYQGQLTIDEILPGYEAVLSQPKLNLTKVTFPQAQHWQALMDPNGFFVNGQAIPLPPTTVSSTNSSQLNVVFDNGFPLSQLPQQMVDAIYKNVSGAKYNATSQLYTVPCTAEINVTFTFGGVAYPTHPLDTVSLGSVLAPPVSGCVGAFQVSTVPPGNGLDLILGMSFLKNVYMLNSFGTLVNPNTSAPYTQLLSLTNDTVAVHKEFLKVRTSGAAARVGTVGSVAAATALAAIFAVW